MAIIDDWDYGICSNTQLIVFVDYLDNIHKYFPLHDITLR
jgi:hypothetical protein